MKFTEARKRLKPFLDKTRDYLSRTATIDFDGVRHLCASDGHAFVAIETPDAPDTPEDKPPESWATVIGLASEKPSRTAVLTVAALADAHAKAEGFYVRGSRRKGSRAVRALGAVMDAKLLLDVLKAAAAKHGTAYWPKNPLKDRVLKGNGWRAVVMPIRLNSRSKAELPRVKTTKVVA